MAKEQGKKGFIERGAGLVERLHYVIGAVALGAAVVFESTTAAVIGVYEFAHGALWNWIKNRSSKKPKAALAPG